MVLIRFRTSLSQSTADAPWFKITCLQFQLFEKVHRKKSDRSMFMCPFLNEIAGSSNKHFQGGTYYARCVSAVRPLDEEKSSSQSVQVIGVLFSLIN